jgi:tRNA uridine 5-carboxymethylaminomethyl modification enzyme
MYVQGPAVWALRAQTDKLEYSREMRRLLERTANLDIREGMATDLEFGPNEEVTGKPAFPPHVCRIMCTQACPHLWG